MSLNIGTYFFSSGRRRPAMRQGEAELPQGGGHAEGEGGEDEGRRTG